jgi:hypothetical protein
MPRWTVLTACQHQARNAGTTFHDSHCRRNTTDPSNGYTHRPHAFPASIAINVVIVTFTSTILNPGPWPCNSVPFRAMRSSMPDADTLSEWAHQRVQARLSSREGGRDNHPRCTGSEEAAGRRFTTRPCLQVMQVLRVIIPPVTPTMTWMAWAARPGGPRQKHRLCRDHPRASRPFTSEVAAGDSGCSESRT